MNALRPLSALMLIGVAVGCGDNSDGVPIAGQVTYQGQPIGNGSLTFFPEQGRPVTANLSADGSYACQLPMGAYRVAVSVGVTLPAGWKEGDPVPPQAIQLPGQYSSRLNTPLTASVAPDQSAPIDFALK